MKQTNLVLNKYNLDEGFWFQHEDEIFKAFKNSTLDYDKKHKRRVFLDNGGQVLLVAHLDTVLPPKIKRFKSGCLYAQGLDDRLGCIIAYKLSQLLGADLLLTDNEESGESTALYHNTEYRYNWIAEFDRGGTDVVTYDIDSPEWLVMLGNYWKVGLGSFSDIAFLETDVCCLNMGIGYHLDHSASSYAIAEETNNQIAKFIRFYEANKNTRFEYDFGIETYNRNTYNRNLKFSEYDWACDFCGNNYDTEEVFGFNICQDCFLKVTNIYMRY